MLPTLTRHHRVVIASVRDPELERHGAPGGPIAETYDAAAAEQRAAPAYAHRRVLKRLGRGRHRRRRRAAAAGAGRPLPGAEGAGLL